MTLTLRKTSMRVIAVLTVDSKVVKHIDLIKDASIYFTLFRTIQDIEVTSWLVSADDFSSRVARGANERVSAANE